MPIVTSYKSTNNHKSIIAGVRIQKPSRKLNEFFYSQPNKKQKTEMSSSPVQQQQLIEEEKKTIELIHENVPVKRPVTITQIPQQRIKELTSEHVKWMQGYIDSEQYTGGWVVTEYIDGKEIVLYTDGANISTGTPYHGIIDKDLIPMFQDPEVLNRHVFAFYNKVKKMDPKVDQLALKLVIYGSRMNPGSVYTNTDIRMMLVDVYWRYEDEYKLMQYTRLCDLLDTKGAFLDENGKGIERLCFKAPRVMYGSMHLDQVVKYMDHCVEINDKHTSDADPTVKVTGYIIKSDADFRVLPKNKKHKEPVRVIGKHLIAPKDGYQEFSLSDLTGRLEGPVASAPPPADSAAADAEPQAVVDDNKHNGTDDKQE